MVEGQAPADQLSGEVEQLPIPGTIDYLTVDEMPLDGEGRVVDPDRCAAPDRKLLHPLT
jgi:hypothetical protein